jgi:hypothetical protein
LNTWRLGAWVAALLAAGGLISFRSMYDTDLWWHLAQGREAAGGHLVRTNLFSFVYPDYPQPYTAWLFDLGGYVLWTRGGAAALQAGQALLIASTLALVALACRIRSSAAAAISACVFGWMILEPRALPRPHVVSFLGFAACVWLVERARQSRSAAPLWWLPVVIAVWSNLHVECVFGLALVGLFAGSEFVYPRDLTRRDAAKALGIVAAGVLATACNPYGFGLLRYMFENTFVPQVLDIAELRPPYLPNYRAFFAWTIAGALLVALSWLGRRRLDGDGPGRRLVRRSFREAGSLGEGGFDVAAIALFAALAFRYLRLTPLLFLVSAPLVARSIDDLRRFRIDARFVAIATIVLSFFLAREPLPSLVRAVQIGGNALTPPAIFSEPAMRFARQHGLAGPVFTSMNLGGFVVWELYPSARVFLDSRLQAYPATHFRTVMAAARDPRAWAAVTAGVDWGVLSTPRVNDLSGVGQFTEPEWGTAYEDGAIQIVVRRSGPYGRLADR